MTHKQQKNNGTPKPAYFKSLTVKNVISFKGEQTIDFSDGYGKPAPWTVILGDNNTGKTTNLVWLEKKGDHVTIKQSDITTYKGWTIE
ncbi:MAG: hypothetical protein DRR19_02230 [Candidatus Parabeggiatoa sp. nov. 1]|nr:MAG: hypothetical protein DRR19_02230 [Gammaproteobacteria bacterium]